MRLVRFETTNGVSSFGVHTDAGVLNLPPRVPFPSIEALLVDPDGLSSALARATEPPDIPFEAIRAWLPPVGRPPKILCIGVNYDAHRRETGRERSAHPTVFARFAHTLVGHLQPLLRPAVSERFDFEGELAVIIGREGRRIDRDRALEHIAGYACFNDGSVRDFQRHTTQFTPGKNFDRTGGFGPWMVTSDEIPDPQALKLRTTVGGEVMQSAPTEHMIFPVAVLIEYLSSFCTLQPGDVIATGTPGGVGDRRDPPRYLRPGETVEVTIEGVGTLVNPIAQETIEATPDPSDGR